MWAINQAELIVFKKIELGVFPWWSLWVVLGVFLAIGLWLLWMVQQLGVISFRLLKRS
jgi:hypothetical protein